jgi:Uma2 family endonuclease
MDSLKDIAAQPRTLEEFVRWEPTDSHKYEWNDGELIQFTGMNKKQVYIYDYLNTLFIEKGYWKSGTLVAEYDVQLSGIQMRRPDISYLSKSQIQATKQTGEDVIPAFVIEILSDNDNVNKVEEKVEEYFKAGVKVVWNIYFEQRVVYVYTGRKTVKICTDDDICSAAPVLPDYEVSVTQLFA